VDDDQFQDPSAATDPSAAEAPEGAPASSVAPDDHDAPQDEQDQDPAEGREPAEQTDWQAEATAARARAEAAERTAQQYQEHLDRQQQEAVQATEQRISQQEGQFEYAHDQLGRLRDTLDPDDYHARLTTLVAAERQFHRARAEYRDHQVQALSRSAAVPHWVQRIAHEHGLNEADQQALIRDYGASPELMPIAAKAIKAEREVAEMKAAQQRGSRSKRAGQMGEAWRTGGAGPAPGQKVKPGSTDDYNSIPWGRSG